MPRTMIDLFAGIGGFTLGFEAAGFECIGHCEIDRYAQRSYYAIHGKKEGAWFADDISTVRPEELPPCDLITAGFPCQDISIAGRGRGLSGSRSSLFFEIIRIIQGKSSHDKPRWVVLENVKNLLSIGRGKDFTTVLCTLAESGYDVEYQVLNSKNFGVPQNRERVFIVGHLRGRGTGKIFPILGADSKNLIELSKGRQGERIYDPAGIGVTLTAQAGGIGGKTGLYAVSYNRKNDIGKTLEVAHTLTASNYPRINRNQPPNAVFIDLSNQYPQISTVARCLKLCYNAGITNRQADNSGVLLSPRSILTPDRAAMRQNGRRTKEPDEPMFTLTAQDRPGVVLVPEATKKGYAEAGIGDSIDLAVPGSKTRRGRVAKGVAHTLVTSCCQGVFDGCRIRRLTPRECWRLQGVPDYLFELAQAVNSDTQLYKQAGNGVTVNVIYVIARKLLEKETRNERDEQ
ncbi:DNA cytosine methyltransferase [Desulfosporosinus lacus]|uniref:Cytosine-specific methyltransferase n=1 Tax=Desulfosporosinus lacus DSM 15449 TaxID=1121420 RepID=A0A1M5V2G1_9FIRM|nr:DNA cytosine methyltransferase [Desulfosporosinus lacus]SHH69288.1 DNA (cytosine-5)-methyltransferase 1 [Desulfosporosinus lacus DSM 15449]